MPRKMLTMLAAAARRLRRPPPPRRRLRPPGFTSLFNGKDLTAGACRRATTATGACRRRDRLRRGERGRRREAPLDGEGVRRLHAAPGLADQGDAVHEPERAHREAGRHVQARRRRQARAHGGAGLRLRGSTCAASTRRRSTSGPGRSARARSTATAPTTRCRRPCAPGVTPKKLADRNIGEWNTFEITVKGSRLTVVLNGERVIDERRAARPARARPHRPAAPRRQEGREVELAAGPGAVPEHLDQGALGPLAAREHMSPHQRDRRQRPERPEAPRLATRRLGPIGSALANTG